MRSLERFWKWIFEEQKEEQKSERQQALERIVHFIEQEIAQMEDLKQKIDDLPETEDVAALPPDSVITNDHILVCNEEVRALKKHIDYLDEDITLLRFKRDLVKLGRQNVALEYLQEKSDMAHSLLVPHIQKSNVIPFPSGDELALAHQCPVGIRYLETVEEFAELKTILRKTYKASR